MAGIAGLTAAVVVFALMLRSEEVARRFGLLAGQVATRLLRLVRRPPVAGWELATVKFRTRTVGLVAGPPLGEQVLGRLGLTLQPGQARFLIRLDDLPTSRQPLAYDRDYLAVGTPSAPAPSWSSGTTVSKALEVRDILPCGNDLQMPTNGVQGSCLLSSTTRFGVRCARCVPAAPTGAAGR